MFPYGENNLQDVAIKRENVVWRRYSYVTNLSSLIQEENSLQPVFFNKMRVVRRRNLLKGERKLQKILCYIE
jgi:hypothetical protein